MIAAIAGCGKVGDVDRTREASLVALGRMLFFDAALSADGTVSCASCHRPDRAYSDGLARAAGTGGRQGARNVPSLLDVAHQRTLFWDGRRTRLDRFLAGKRDAMSAEAQRGWVVFSQQAQCTRCHIAAVHAGARPLFTDHQFHSLAVGFAKVERKLPQLTARVAELRRGGRPLGRDVLLDAELAELGRFVVTLEPRDVAAFKTPGLRNVALTAPYMHDGSVATLGEAVDLEVYGRGDRSARPLILTPTERGDLLAFLQALTSDGHDEHGASE